MTSDSSKREPEAGGHSLLDKISAPADLDDLSPDEMEQLAEEIRDKLITTLARTGGHLGPNLGVVELSIALNRVFESPRDKFVFDVSHQGYVHKMLTGRADRIHTIRQYEGLNGFLLRTESEHDAYGAGHAGTALSAALGMAAARDLKGDDNHVVAVAGDAAFTCGPTLEALNNIAHTTKRFIVVLNDNEWSIDKNVGAIAKYFNALQTHSAYATESAFMLKVKHIMLLFSSTLQQYGFSADKMYALLHELRDHYTEVLMQKWVGQFRNIFDVDNYHPMQVRKMIQDTSRDEHGRDDFICHPG